MIDEKAIQRVVDTVTPQRLRELIVQLGDELPPDMQGSVPTYLIFDALAQGFGRLNVWEQMTVEAHLRKAVKAAIEQAPDELRWVRGCG